MIHILYGEDDFSCQEELRRIKAQSSSADFLDNNTTVLDGKQLTLAQLIGVCDAAPFFSSFRLVIVKGLMDRFEPKFGKGAEKSSRRADGIKLMHGLEAYVKNIPATTILIFIDGHVRPSNSILKRLSPLSKVSHFPALKGKDLYAWIQERISAKGAKASPNAVRLLADLIGSNLWILSNEIDKLLLFISDSQIGDGDISVMVSYAREANMFAMMDAIMAHRLDVAQRLLTQCLDEGIKAPQILAFFVRQLRLVFITREAIQQRASRQDIRSRLGITSDYALDKIAAQARQSSTETLKRAYSMILNADMTIKRGIMNDDLAMEVMVAELCQR